MKKSLIKILIACSALVTAFVLLTRVSTNFNVYADEHEGHDEIGNGWDSTDHLPNYGNYYLKKDVTLTSTWKPEGNVKLCLNGHGIKMTGEGNVIDVTCITNVLERSLYLYDCTTVEHKYTFNEDGLAVVDDSLTENYQTFTGGYITGGNGTEHGGGIFLDPGDTNTATSRLFTDGITIIGNKTTGKGGGICYNYSQKKNSLIELKNTSIIGNYAKQGGGGISHAANNKYLSLENVTVKNNVSEESAAGILESAQLKIKGKIYVYDNIIKTADGNIEKDIFVHNNGQDDRLIVTGALEEGSKIGIYGLRRYRIYDYYKYNEAAPNDIFVSNTYQAFDKSGDDINTTGIPETQYINIDDNDHTIKILDTLLNYEHTIKYGTVEGTYDLDEAPAYKDLGVYTIYYKLSTNPSGEITGKQVLTIDKKLPLLPVAVTDLIYNGEAQELITIPENACATYRFKMDGGYWSDNIPKGFDVSEYVIHVRGTGDADHADVELDLKATIISPDKQQLRDAITAATEYHQSISEDYRYIAIELWKETADAKAYTVLVSVTADEVNAALEQVTAALEKAKAGVQRVDDVMALIDAIGEVALTDESKTKIDSARTAYDALDEYDKRIIRNYEALTNAEGRYAELKADSDAAAAVSEAIDSIGDVTLDSKARIDEVRASYNGLSDAQKALVTNLETLTNAEAAYDDLKGNKDVAVTVENQISELGEILFDDESKARIDAARASYDLLTDLQKSLVSNYEVLTNAEARYLELKTDNEAAAVVYAAINSIGDVTIDSKAKIDEVRASYDALTDNQKALITNLDTLTNAEARYEEILADKQAAEAVDAKINEIGDLAYTAECKEKITNAKVAYNALTDAQKSFVTGFDTLTKKEKSYTNIDRTYRVINNIESVELTNESNSKIAAARASYDGLSEEEKNLVPNLNKLTTAEDEYRGLVHNNNMKFLAMALIVSGSILVLLLVTFYVLFFFVFNSYTLIKYKQKRVFKIGRKDGKVRLLRMNFKIVYRDEVDVYKYKK